MRLCICARVPRGRLTAAVDDRGAGWQGDLLELRGNYGDGRPVYPGLCRGGKKQMSREQ